jgi:hypothetical protein
MNQPVQLQNTGRSIIAHSCSPFKKTHLLVPSLAEGKYDQSGTELTREEKRNSGQMRLTTAPKARYARRCIVTRMLETLVNCSAAFARQKHPRRVSPEDHLNTLGAEDLSNLQAQSSNLWLLQLNEDPPRWGLQLLDHVRC